MAKVYFHSAENREWQPDTSGELRACGPFLLSISELAELDIGLESRTDKDESMAVPRGLGMGWPEQKDLAAMHNFAEEAEKIKLDGRTTQ